MAFPKTRHSGFDQQPYAEKNNAGVVDEDERGDQLQCFRSITRRNEVPDMNAI